MQAGAWRGLLLTLLVFLAVGVTVSGQSQQPKSLPDAPQPQKTFPPPEAPAPAESSSHDAAPPAAQPRVDQPREPDAGNPANANGDNPAAPSQQARNPVTPDTDRLYKLGITTNFVEIPVTVKDGSGRMVEGLLPKDFTVYENGVRQKLTYFTSDPLAISAAVLIDVGMPDTSLRKVQSGLQALQGAFSQYDEIAVYTYGNSVIKESSFTTAGDRLTTALNRIVETKQGKKNAGVPVGGGPFEGGPTVNGRPFDPSVPQVPIIPKDRRVLNDAVLQAALDLSKVQPARRRVIMIIGDGREDGSRASYADVLKVLLTNKISVYAIGVGVPVIRKLEQINVPGTGTGNILPKYASATGGEVFSEFNKQAIENAYSAVTVVARNQYTLGYYAQGTLAENYRDIEVRVAHPGLRVTAKAGYYPLPPGRQ